MKNVTLTYLLHNGASLNFELFDLQELRDEHEFRRTSLGLAEINRRVKEYKKLLTLLRIVVSHGATIPGEIEVVLRETIEAIKILQKLARRHYASRR